VAAADRTPELKRVHGNCSSTRRYARLTILIDRLMPEFDATRIEHRVVAARVSDAYAAAVGIDFVDPVRESHALRGLFALRAGTGRSPRCSDALARRSRRGGSEALRLTDLPEHGDTHARD
jgi:hypothetical protein